MGKLKTLFVTFYNLAESLWRICFFCNYAVTKYLILFFEYRWQRFKYDTTYNSIKKWNNTITTNFITNVSRKPTYSYIYRFIHFLFVSKHNVKTLILFSYQTYGSLISILRLYKSHSQHDSHVWNVTKAIVPR